MNHQDSKTRSGDFYRNGWRSTQSANLGIDSASLGKLRFDMTEEDRQRWGEVMDNAYDRTARGLGWLLVVGAALVIVGYGGYEFVLADWEAPLVKWAVAALYVGFAVLLLSVLHQRLRAHQKDRYKDVEI